MFMLFFGAVLLPSDDGAPTTLPESRTTTARANQATACCFWIERCVKTNHQGAIR